MNTKEILHFIYKNGKDGNYVDLLDYFLKKYPKPSDTILKDAVISLNELLNRKLIRLSEGTGYKSLGTSMTSVYDERDPTKLVTIDFEELFKWSQAKPDKKIDGIKAKIKYDGILEMDKILFSKKVKKVNKSVIDSNSNQKKLGYLTLIVAGLSFIAIAASAYYSSLSVTAKEFLRIDSSLQNNTKVLDNMRQVQIRIDSSLKSMVKIDSLKNAKSPSVAPAK